MQANKFNARRGWNWMMEGFRLFRRNPSLLGFLVFGYWFLLLLIDIVPVIGPVLTALCAPALSVSVMNGCRSVDKGERVELGLLMSGFRRHPRMLATLGGLNFICLLAVLWLSTTLDGGALMQAMTQGRMLDLDAALSDSRVQFSIVVTLLLMVPVMMAFWFAPMLVAWDNLSPGKALFFSFVASWRNGKAFYGYGAAVILFSGLLPGLVMVVAAIISTTFLSFVVAALTLFVMLVFVPAMFASFYVSYRDVFALPPEEPEAALETPPPAPTEEPPAPPPGDAPHA